MKQEYIVKISTSIIQKNGDKIMPYTLRAIEWIIASDVERRELHIQKLNKRTLEWNTPITKMVLINKRYILHILDVPGLFIRLH